MSNEIDDIWSDDLFSRKSDALLLASFIESIGGAGLLNEDDRGTTIAIDADYGIGKTFFLKRLTRHLGLNHPVAYVDAWADDLADQPLVALAATLRQSIAPLIDSNNAVRSGWRAFTQKAGRVAAIAAKGLLIRGIGAAITAKGAEELAGIVTDKDLSDTLKDGLQDAGKETVEALLDNDWLNERIDEYEQGRRAVADLKASLRAIVDALPHAGLHAPIVIVVDELDRCRPSYAIKFLEEVKHIFDVPGVVFVFGIHSGQLANAMAGIYGASFASAHYLRRFISRRITLTSPKMLPLVKSVFQKYPHLENQLRHPPIRLGMNHHPLGTIQVIAVYFDYWDLSPRDCLRACDIIRTCAELSKPYKLELTHLLPEIIAYITDNTSPPTKSSNIQIEYTDRSGNNPLNPIAHYNQWVKSRKLTDQELNTKNEHTFHERMIFNQVEELQKVPNEHANLRHYDRLVRRVGRLSKSEDE